MDEIINVVFEDGTSTPTKFCGEIEFNKLISGDLPRGLYQIKETINPIRPYTAFIYIENLELYEAYPGRPTLKFIGYCSDYGIIRKD